SIEPMPRPSAISTSPPSMLTLRTDTASRKHETVATKRIIAATNRPNAVIGLARRGLRVAGTGASLEFESSMAFLCCPLTELDRPSDRNFHHRGYREIAVGKDRGRFIL